PSNASSRSAYSDDLHLDRRNPRPDPQARTCQHAAGPPSRTYATSRSVPPPNWLLLQVTSHQRPCQRVLACLCEMYEVLRPAPTTIPAQQFPSLARGENLCTAYEIYRAITLNSLISFEHGVLLATALAQGDELALNPCQECGGLFLIDRFAHHDERCEHCRPGVERKLVALRQRG